MIPVDSDMARAIGHDASTGNVWVEFHKGGIHPFGPFTKAEFERFRDAPSIGKHFHSHVKAKAIK